MYFIFILRYDNKNQSYVRYMKFKLVMKSDKNKKYYNLTHSNEITKKNQNNRYVRNRNKKDYL